MLYPNDPIMIHENLHEEKICWLRSVELLCGILSENYDHSGPS